MSIRDLLRKYNEPIQYILWGAATTAVNYCVYFLCTRWLEIQYILADVLAWVAAVIFAFWSNKLFVFESKSWEPRVAVPEFCKFTGARLLSGLMEVGMMWLFVDQLSFHDGLTKLLASVLVIIVNYLFSKLFIFRRRHENG